jgi:hypothetical protein
MPLSSFRLRTWSIHACFAASARSRCSQYSARALSKAARRARRGPSLIETIRVDARDHIEPTYRVPALRIESGYMEPAGIEPATSCLQSRPF